MQLSQVTLFLEWGLYTYCLRLLFFSFGQQSLRRKPRVSLLHTKTGCAPALTDRTWLQVLSGASSSMQTCWGFLPSIDLTGWLPILLPVPHPAVWQCRGLSGGGTSSPVYKLAAPLDKKVRAASGQKGFRHGVCWFSWL